MSKTIFTDEQLEAINIRNVNTTVSASAGAGKTAVLVERLMRRILDDKISVDTIVSLTFTDAAAAEMKNRLMQALLSELDKNPTDEYLLEQITLLPSADISTIHSFCLSILKDYYYVLNIDPARLNNILTDSEDLEVHSEAFDYVISNYDSDKITYLMTHLSSNALNLERLNLLIKDLLSHANATINPNLYLENSVSVYKQYESISELPTVYVDILFSYLSNYTSSLNNSFLAARDSISSFELTTAPLKKADAWIKAADSKINQMQQHIINKDYNSFTKAFEQLVTIPNANVSKNVEFNNLRKAIYVTFADLSKSMFDEREALKHLAIMEAPLQILKEMAIMYNTYYKNKITMLNKITFNDMETLTYELLSKNNNEVAAIIREQITDILVDEFQDTNELQDAIISLIGNGHNIFRVGDVKQSIYRFRGAQPSIMQSLLQLPDSNEHKTIYLSKNFRSKHDIVEYNNHLFKQLMEVEGMDGTYNENDIVAVGTSGQQANSLPVELIKLNSKSDGLTSEQAELNDVQLKAHYIASKIVQLAHEDDNIKWNKFTVLVNSHAVKQQLKIAFDEVNIPYFIALPDGLFDTDGVSTMLAYLKLINNPNDKISIVAVLTNLYGITENEIAKEYLQTKDLKQVALNLVPDLMDTVYKFNKLQHEISVSHLLSQLSNINGFYEYKLSKQNRTNFDIFFERALAYDNTNSGLYGFLKEVEISRNAKVQEGSSISSDDNVVNVMTIHNSKGLQFDTVFLMSKSKYVDNNASKKYLVHPQYGLAIKSTEVDTYVEHENIIHNIIKYKDKQASIEEDIRVLYVALTRAQNRLYIVDTAAMTKDSDVIGDDGEKLAATYSEKEPIQINKANLMKSSYTTWISGVAYENPSKYLIGPQLIGEFELSMAEEIKRAKISIKKRDFIDIPVVEKFSNFKPRPLTLRQQVSGSDIGTLVHETIEHLGSLPWSKDLIVKNAPSLPPYYIDRLLNLGNNEMFNNINQEANVQHEVPFVINKNGSYEQGIIDFVSIKNETIYIVDFKTDSLETEAEFIQLYSNQINDYAYALSIQYPNHKIEKYLYSFKLQTFITL